MTPIFVSAFATFFAGTDPDKQAKAPEPFATAHSQRFCWDDSGKRLIGVTQRGDLLYWEARDAAEPKVIKLEQPAVPNLFNVAPSGVTLDRDGKHAALFYHDGRAQLWDLAAGRKIRDLACDGKQLSTARSSPDGKLIASVSWPKEPYGTSNVLFWNTADWSPAGKLDTEKNNYHVYQFCFSSDGARMFLCVGYPTDLKDRGFTGIVVFDVKTKKEIERLEYGDGFPTHITVSPDGRWVATGGGDAVPSGGRGRNLSGHLRIFDWNAKKLATELYTVNSDYVRCVEFSPDGKRLFAGAEVLPRQGNVYSGEMRAFSVGDWRNEWTTDVGGTTHSFTVSSDGQILLVPTSKGLHDIDAKTGRIVRERLRFRFTAEDKAFFDKLRPRDQ